MKKENEARTIARYFYGATGFKTTSSMFMRQMGIAQNLLNSGYTKHEIMKAIDYCIENPPRNGFTSLGWLSYAMNEITVKVRAEEIRAMQSSQEPILDAQPNDQIDSIGNMEKFAKKAPKGFKGQVKF